MKNTLDIVRLIGVNFVGGIGVGINMKKESKYGCLMNTYDTVQTINVHNFDRQMYMCKI